MSPLGLRRKGQHSFFFFWPNKFHFKPLNMSRVHTTNNFYQNMIQTHLLRTVYINIGLPLLISMTPSLSASVNNLHCFTDGLSLETKLKNRKIVPLIINSSNEFRAPMLTWAFVVLMYQLI